MHTMKPVSPPTHNYQMAEPRSKPLDKLGEGRRILHIRLRG